jgi:hypothetical protein
MSFQDYPSRATPPWKLARLGLQYLTIALAFSLSPKGNINYSRGFGYVFISAVTTVCHNLQKKSINQPEML